MVSKESRDFLLKAGAAVAGIGIVGGLAYTVVKSVVQPSPQCSDPNSACYQALQPYVSEIQVCATEYKQLMDQAIQGQTLTSSQLQALDQLRACMDTASKNIGTVASQYNEGNLLAPILDAVGALIVLYVLSKIGMNVYDWYTKHGPATPPRGGAGIAATIANAEIQFAVSQGLINAVQASEFMAGVRSYTADDTAAVSSLWSYYVSANIVTLAYANANISFLDNTLAADEGVTVSLLSGL